MKIRLANKTMVDWMDICKKKSKNVGKCQWYQPSTQNQRLRTFFGSCTKHFDWRFEVNNFDFKDGLKGVYPRCTENATRILGQQGTEKLDPTKRLDESAQEKIDLSLFDESDPRQHQMKLLVGCGIYFGLRGNIEHTDLDVSNITHGAFSSNHPFYGHIFFGIDNLQDKTHKLSMFKDRVRDTIFL